VLTDLSLESSLSGFEIVGFARRHTSKPAIIVLSGFPDLLSKWKEKGADAGFQKPIDIRELVSTIKTLLLLRDWKRNRGSR
jgi:DNA-binding response OmpR family regulator